VPRRPLLARRKRKQTGPDGAAAPGEGCLVCGHGGLVRRTVAWRKNANRARDVTICRHCGFVAAAELSNDRYRGKTSLEELPTVGLRAGTMEQAGREFQMARMALDILGREESDVLVYGAGRSMDNHHIKALPNVGHVAIGDIMNARDDMEFHDANEPARRQFDIVVASEVIEHFRNPRENFRQLSQFVNDEGIIVCGTSLRGHRPLRDQRYLFYPDHTALYSPESLQLIAGETGFHLDLRHPEGLGPRKRYVILTRSPQTMKLVTRYFGYTPIAPSEKTAERMQAQSVDVESETDDIDRSDAP
jgi:SAM-dependent methyltransferase